MVEVENAGTAPADAVQKLLKRQFVFAKRQIIKDEDKIWKIDEG